MGTDDGETSVSVHWSCLLPTVLSRRGLVIMMGGRRSNTLYPEIPRPGLPCVPYTQYCGLRVECWAIWRFLWALHGKEMATHSGILSWRIPGTEEPGGLPSMGSPRVGRGWSDLAATAAWRYALVRLLFPTLVPLLMSSLPLEMAFLVIPTVWDAVAQFGRSKFWSL